MTKLLNHINTYADLTAYNNFHRSLQANWTVQTASS